MIKQVLINGLILTIIINQDLYRRVSSESKRIGHFRNENELFFLILVVPAGFKSESEILSPIAIPYAPAQGSGNGGIGPFSP